MSLDFPVLAGSFNSPTDTYCQKLSLVYFSFYVFEGGICNIVVNIRLLNKLFELELNFC